MPYVSDLLTAAAASVTGTPTPTRSWQWLRGSTLISGATSSTYTVADADIGSALSVRQIESNIAGVATATSVATAAVQAFEPIALFQNSEEGAWYDPSDLSTVWQDAAGTIPATAGDPVGRIDDKSGNGKHATQSTSTARPTLQTSGGLYYLDFDGVDDWMQTAPTGFASTSDSMIAFAGNGPASTATIVNAVGLTAGGYQSQTDNTLLRINLSGSSIFYINNPNVTQSQTYPGATTSVFVGYTTGSTLALRIDASELTTARTPTTYTFDQEIDIGALDNAGSIIQYSDLHFYGAIIRLVAPTPAEIASLESYLATKSGVTLP